ncbi:MAG: hypothetical protein KC493_15660 [Bacteriovoracaceae bacterium]|nr:hypothetical protein [Bacteriovoracaceae bacterium]
MDPIAERCAGKCGSVLQAQCKCSDGRLIGLGGNATCCSDGVVHSANELNRLIEVMNPQVQCSLDHTRLRQNSCPQFLVNMIDDDFSDSDISNGCKDYTPTPPAIRGGNEGYKLEKVFRANPELFGFIQEGDPIALACVNGSNSIHKHNPKWQAALATSYYVGKKRLRDGFFSIQQSLSNLDKILGAKCSKDEHFGKSSSLTLQGISCAKHRHVAGSVPKCNKLKTKCNNEINYSSMFEDTADSLQMVRAMKKGVESLEDENQKKVLEQQIQIYENSNPWLKGEIFNESYKSERKKCFADNNGAGEGFCDNLDKFHTCKAVVAQAQSTRNKLNDVLNEYSTALKCLDGIEGGCDKDQVREALKKAPQFTAFPKPEMPESIVLESEQGKLLSIRREKSNFANEQLGLMECREAYRGNIEEYRQVRNELLIGAALTVATAGAGSIAGGGAAWVASARVAQTAGKALSVAQRVRMVAGTGAQVARYAAIGLDVADMARSVYDAVNKCGNNFDQVSDIKKPSSNACPIESKYDGTNQTNSFSSCMKSDGIWLALSALPIVPAAVKEVLDRRTLKNAKLLMGVADDFPLNHSQREAIVSFLSASKKGALAGDDLLTHLEVLKGANLPEDLILKLMKNKADPEVVARALGKTAELAPTSSIDEATKRSSETKELFGEINSHSHDGYWASETAQELGKKLLKVEAESYPPGMKGVVDDIQARGKKPVFRAVAGDFDPNFKYQYDGVSWSESATVALGHGESHSLMDAVLKNKKLKDITIVIGEVDPNIGGKAFDGSIGRGTSGADAMEVLLDAKQSSMPLGAFTIKAEDLEKLLENYPPGTTLGDIADSFDELVAENMHLLKKADGGPIKQARHSARPTSFKFPEFSSSTDQAGSLTGNKVGDNLEMLDLVGKDGSQYHLKTILSKNAEGVETVSYEVLRKSDGAKVGKGTRTLVNGSYGMGSIEIVPELRGQGVGGQINKAFYEMAPKGTQMIIDNGNQESMKAFHRMAQQVSENPSYKQILNSGNKKAAEEFMTREVKRQALELAKSDPKKGVLWVNLLQKAGWDNIELIPQHTYRRRKGEWIYNFNLKMTK